MRNLFVIIMMIPMIAWAQVRVAKPAERADKQVVPYDSTANYLDAIGHSEILRGYIGQEFYVLPKSEAFQKHDYGNFSREKTGYISGRIPYAELAEKTLRVVDVSHGGRTTYDGNYYLTLIDDSNNDTLYFQYPEYNTYFPFLVLGYKKKYEKTFKGKTFLFKGVERDDFSDFNTGKSVHLKPGDHWVFNEIIVVPQTGHSDEIRYLFSNSKGEHLALNEDNMVSKAKMERLSKKYGQRLCNRALNLKIEIGMPKELVEIAWGEPKTINRSSYGEQWVYGEYGDNCVYFKSGKVTGWN